MATALERLQSTRPAAPAPGRALARLQGAPGAPPEQPEFMATLRNPPQLQRMREPFMSPEMEGLEQQTITHYRNLGGLVGLPVETPTPEDQAAYQNAAIDALGFMAGGGTGKVVSGLGKAAIKQTGRGFRTRPGAQQVIDQAERLGTKVPDGGKASTTLARELAAGSAAGTAVVATPDALAPGDLPEWAEYVIGAALPATVFGVRGADTLLTGNPAFRRFVMSTSRGGKVATLIGGLIGLVAADGLQAAKDAAQQALDYLNSIGEGEEN